MHERPVAQVPRAVLAMLVLGLAAQIGLRASAPQPRAKAEELAAAPDIAVLRLASVGEPIALARMLMLYLQAFDYQSGSRIPYRDLDYGRLEGWLERILELDPPGQYPLLAASRVYAEVPVEAKTRSMLEFIHREFLKDPNRRWRWLADAAVIAKHQLHDLPLARRYAASIQREATGKNVPLWAKQMEAFILEDMNELETARIMIGGYVSSGEVKDPAELRFLDQHLKELEKKIAAESRDKNGK
jgi:hypothetical protein